MTNVKRFICLTGNVKRNPAEGSNAFEYVRTNQIMGDKNPKLYDKIALTPNEKYIIRLSKLLNRKLKTSISFERRQGTRPIG